MFYEFRQNNSGGRFDFNLIAGISHLVIIEASSEDEAIDKAKTVGLYFDGEGDCSCCGPRWSDHYPQPSEVPSIYGNAVVEGDPLPSDEVRWFDGPQGFIHYKDGRIAPFWV